MWFVPLLILFVLVGFGGLFVLIQSLLKSSDAYSGALARAESSPPIIAALGTPIKDGFFFSGNISEVNSSGNANLAIPIHGPKGAATVYVSATRTSGQWHFDKMVVWIAATKEQIDISDTNSLTNSASTNIFRFTDKP
jgi:hypothetical protein